MSESFSFRPFKNLKKMIEGKGFHDSAAGNTSKTIEKTNDEELFLNAMEKVKEIKEYRAIPVYQKRVRPLHKKVDPCRETMRILEEITKGKRDMPLTETQEYIEWHNSDYHYDIVRRLHEGHFSVQDYLDLHGSTIMEAEGEVDHFLNDSLKRGLRCIKIIHGRGLRSTKGPVLKDALMKWLSERYRKHIIAFATARQCDGGLGAVYILIRKR